MTRDQHETSEALTALGCEHERLRAAEATLARVAALAESALHGSNPPPSIQVCRTILDLVRLRP